MHGKIVVVTGCTSGIGKETARECARLGAHVIMACRNLPYAQKIAKLFIQETQNPNIEVIECDLASQQSIRQFATHFLSKYRRLDALVLNAGIFSAKRTFTREGFEMHYGVNHLGHFLLTMLLLPALHLGERPTVVSLSSFLHLVGRIDFANFKAESGYGPTSAYAQSKLANILFMKQLALFVANIAANTPIKTYAFNPGSVSTNIMSAETNWFRKVSDFIFKSPKVPAKEIISLIENRQYDSGSYLTYSKLGKVSPLASDTALAQRLWNASLAQCAIDEQTVRKNCGLTQPQNQQSLQKTSA